MKRGMPEVAVLVLAVLLLIFCLQGLPLLRKGQWRELSVFMVLFSLAGILLFSYALNYKPPNPADLIRFLTKPVAEIIFRR